MNRQWLFAVWLGALSTQLAAQTTAPEAANPPSASAIIEGAGDNSVNTQATAAQEERNVRAQDPMPSADERAKGLAPMMDIQAWLAGAGAANGAANAAKGQALPRADVHMGSSEMQQELHDAATP